MIGLIVIIGILILISIPLLIWHFLVFPNLDGVIQDLAWYNYDSQSQHFLYWVGFWLLVLGFGGNGMIRTANHK